LRRSSALLTFDDGYRDNYDLAFPVLRSLNASAVFFLVSSYVGSSEVPWWDEIAYLVKRSRKSELLLEAPFARTLPVGPTTISQLLALYKRLPSEQTEAFLTALREATGTPSPSSRDRLFLNWEEAREMLAKGMSIGSHTVNHVVLSRVPAAQQVTELQDSKKTLEQQLAHRVESFAYPVGSREAFTAETRHAVRQAGYRAAFSFYGEPNGSRPEDPFDVRRSSVSMLPERFRLQTTLARVSSSYWF
jgi:peptidoglycan/xylan/chitin deacetylase (PgdA/CDA1 family)